MKSHLYMRNQQGVALIITLLILIVLTLIVLAGSRNTTLQLRMASNLESRIEAVEFAQAGLDFAKNIDLSALQADGDAMCSTTYPDTSICNKGTFTLPDPLNSGLLNVIIYYDGWTYLDETSIEKIKAALFRAVSSYDNTTAGQGRATLSGGMLIFTF